MHLVGLVDLGVQHGLDFLEGGPVPVDLPLEEVLGFSEPFDIAVEAGKRLGGGDIVMVGRRVQARELLLKRGRGRASGNGPPGHE